LVRQYQLVPPLWETILSSGCSRVDVAASSGDIFVITNTGVSRTTSTGYTFTSVPIPAGQTATDIAVEGSTQNGQNLRVEIVTASGQVYRYTGTAYPTSGSQWTQVYSNLTNAKRVEMVQKSSDLTFHDVIIAGANGLVYLDGTAYPRINNSNAVEIGAGYDRADNRIYVYASANPQVSGAYRLFWWDGLWKTNTRPPCGSTAAIDYVKAIGGGSSSSSDYFSSIMVSYNSNGTYLAYKLPMDNAMLP
jgi:hypothetical protein